MKSYVVIWLDFLGRFRCKQYVYRACAEKFAVKLIVSNTANSAGVRLATLQGNRLIKSQNSRGILGDLSRGVRL